MNITKSTMGNRIRSRRKYLGLTQDNVANYIGVNRVSVSYWENSGKKNYSPKGNNLIALSVILKKSPDWILYGVEDNTEIEKYTSNKYVFQSEDNALVFSKDYFKRAGVNERDAAYEIVTDRSMLPVLRVGSTVVADTSRKKIIDGDMYIINNNGVLQIKVLYQLPCGGFRVKSYNNEEYPDEIIDKNKNVSIVGWVFWWSVLKTWEPI